MIGDQVGTATTVAEVVTDHPPVVTRARRVRRWMRSHPGMVVLLALPIVVFGIPVLFGQTFLSGDNLLQNFPMRVLVGRDLQHGTLPLWNPFLFGGTPLLGGFNAGAAYPTTWLMAVLPVFVAWWLNLALAYEVAIAGMYLFLRRQSVSPTAATFGAATFACSGYMSAQIVHIDLIIGAAWLPWMLIAVHALTRPRLSAAHPSGGGESGAGGRRLWMVVLALSFGLNLLSGGAEAFIDSAVLVLIYGIGRLLNTGLFAKGQRSALFRSVAAMAAGLFGGLLLGAAQWSPGLAFLSQSQRAGSSYAFFTSGSLPARLVTLVASPFLLGTNQNQPGLYAGPYNFPEVTSYAGILALIAACSLFLSRYRTRPEARQWRVWYVVLAIGLLSALGGETPFGRVLYVIPGISSERLLSRNLLLVDFSLAVLLAWWVHLLLTARDDRPPRTTTSVRRRWAGRGRAEVVVTCAPLALIATLGLLLWATGPWLEHRLEIQLTLTTAVRIREAALVTVGVVIAGAATWIALAEPGLSRRRLRRLLAAVLAVDLIWFNCFVVNPPITEAKALANGAASASLRAAVGNGRFIIYDPDEFHTDELYALGQTDLNIHTGLPSGQGYSVLIGATFYDATGAHYQEDLDPNDLVGPVWDQLNVTTLLSLPSYFVTPIPPSPNGANSVQFPTTPFTEFTLPPPSSSFAVDPGQPHRWYFGGALTVDTFTVPLVKGSGTGLKLGLVTPNGATHWLPMADAQPVDVDGHRSVRVALPSAIRAAGIVVGAAGPGSLTVGTPTVRTAEAGEVALNGRMQDEVVPPHWTFTGTIGSFGVFRNNRARGWAWVGAPGGGAPRGATVTGVAPGPDGDQQLSVHTTSAALLIRSESWSPGWQATIGTGSTGSDHPAPPRPTPVLRAGLIQEVRIPGPGDYVVTFSYAPTSATAGLVVSAVAASGLLFWAVAELIGIRRRRRITRAPPRPSPR